MSPVNRLIAASRDLLLRLGTAAGEPSPLVATIALTVSGLLVLSEVYVTIPLAPRIADSLGADGGTAWLSSAFSIAYAIGFLVFGPLSDRHGRRAVIVPGQVALATATIAVAVAPSFGAVIGLRAVQGLAAASFAPAALAYLGEVLPAPARPTATAAVTSSFLAAGILGQVYGGALGGDWRLGFGLLAATHLLTAAALAGALIPSAGSAVQSSIVAGVRQMARLVRVPSLALTFPALLTILFSFVAMYAALGPELQAEYGVGAGDLLVVRLAGLPGMLLAPLSGPLVVRHGPMPIASAGLALAALGLVVEAAAPSLAILILASGVFVAGIAAAAPALSALMGAAAGEARGAAMALYAFLLFCGASLGPLAQAALPVSFEALLGGTAALLAGAALCTRAAGART
jgi:YNFM family putative membrane transporter